MSIQFVIVAQHPTLPYGFDASGRLYYQDRWNGTWSPKSIRCHEGHKYVRFQGRDITVQSLMVACGLAAEWDEHEEERKLLHRHCLTCGRRRNRGPASPFCGRCSKRWRQLRSAIAPQTCDRCGKAYQGHTRKFCGSECREKSHHERLKMTTVERICKVCEMEFRTNKWKSSLCCSDECTAAWKAIRQKDWVMVDGQCRRCKESFRRRVMQQHIHTAGSYCSTQCFKRDKGAANMRGCRKLGRKDLRPLLSTIADRDGWVCQLCHETVDARLSAPDPKCASIDHIIPLSRGGTNDMVNLQLAHYGCNSRKCNRTNEILPGEGQKV